MGRREVIGKEYLLIARREYGDLPDLLGSFPSMEEAQAARQAAAEADDKLILRIESRTLFRVDRSGIRPRRKIVSREVVTEPEEQQV